MSFLHDAMYYNSQSNCNYIVSPFSTVDQFSGESAPVILPLDKKQVSCFIFSCWHLMLNIISRIWFSFEEVV